jgi:hypothetical protein
MLSVNQFPHEETHFDWIYTVTHKKANQSSNQKANSRTLQQAHFGWIYTVTYEKA